VPLALVTVFSLWSVIGSPGAKAQGVSARTSAEAWVCTAIPRRFWLPIGVLTERLSEQGYTVLEALETRDDCYALRLRDRQSRETTVIFDPVSAKPLR
jgi:hypothetical protein